MLLLSPSWTTSRSAKPPRRRASTIATATAGDYHVSVTVDRDHHDDDVNNVDDVDDDETTTSTRGLLRHQQQPTPLTAAQVLAFGLPALGALLADPFCSLVDTAVVGRVEQAAGLAALGPNTAIFGGICQIFSFLTTATTASVARLAGQKAPTGRYVSAALVIAVCLGATCTLGMQFGYVGVLEAMSVSPEMIPLAGAYLRARAFSLPALLVVTVCTAVCLGQRDPKTPLAAAAAATGVNVALDVLLVAGPPNAGVVGAATATSAAQYCAAALLLYRISKNPEVPLRITIPTAEDFAPLTRAWPVALRSVLLMTSIASITASASSLGTVPTAAHQVLLTTLTIAQFFPEPISQCAQSYLAKGAPGTGSRVYVNRSCVTLLTAAGCVSLIAVCFALVPVLSPGLFTVDTSVADAVYACGWALTATCAMLPLVCVTDGLLLARREYAFCTVVLCVTAAVVLLYLGGGGGVSGGGGGGAAGSSPMGRLMLLAPLGWFGPDTLPGVWIGFVILQASRLAQNVARLWWTNGRVAGVDGGHADYDDEEEEEEAKERRSASSAGGGAGGAGGRGDAAFAYRRL